jgi:hypothetical protein
MNIWQDSNNSVPVKIETVKDKKENERDIKGNDKPSS